MNKLSFISFRIKLAQTVRESYGGTEFEVCSFALGIYPNNVCVPHHGY